MNKTLLSHNSDNYRTPTALYNAFIKCGFLDLFPYCSNIDQYGIKYKNEKLFINPPYSHLRTKKFINYIFDLYQSYNDIYLLVPSRTDTIWFYEFYKYSCEIYFIKGRLKFNDSGCAPFPSVLIHINLNGSIDSSTLVTSIDNFIRILTSFYIL